MQVFLLTDFENEIKIDVVFAADESSWVRFQDVKHFFSRMAAVPVPDPGGLLDPRAVLKQLIDGARLLAAPLAQGLTVPLKISRDKNSCTIFGP